jgi:cysteine synthase A
MSDPTATPDGRTVLDAIGDTPLIRVDGIWVKLEYLNPSGSIKARIAKYMIEKAEAEGLLHPGDTIVEASSGNTGNALSMVAAVKGYRMLVVMPNGMSPERAAISRAFGAQVMTLGEFHVTDALAKCASSVRSRGSSRPSSSTASGTSRRTAPGSVPKCCASSPTVSSPTGSSAVSAPAER